MTKLQFLLSLHDKLSGFHQEDVQERLTFYSEMIEDRMEEGLSEADAVAAVGSVEEIAAQISADLLPVQSETNKPKKNRKPWMILLLILGSPIWGSLLIAAFAVGLSLYCAWWAILISLWAVFGSLVVCGIAVIAATPVLMFLGNTPGGLVFLSAAMVSVGLSIFMFLGCKAITKGTILLTGKMFTGFRKGNRK